MISLRGLVYVFLLHTFGYIQIYLIAERYLKVIISRNKIANNNSYNNGELHVKRLEINIFDYYELCVVSSTLVIITYDEIKQLEGTP